MALIRALLMDLSLVVCGVDLRWFYPLLGVIGALCFVVEGLREEMKLNNKGGIPGRDAAFALRVNGWDTMALPL